VGEYIFHLTKVKVFLMQNFKLCCRPNRG